MSEPLDKSVGGPAKNPEEPAGDAPGSALDLAQESDGDPTVSVSTLNLAKEGEGSASVEEYPPYSGAWADIVAPVARNLVQLLAAVILLPFLLIALFGAFDRSTDPVTHVLDWGKTILPPLVGFGGAIVGYYFGTRGGTQGPGPTNND